MGSRCWKGERALVVGRGAGFCVAENQTAPGTKITKEQASGPTWRGFLSHFSAKVEPKTAPVWWGGRIKHAIGSRLRVWGRASCMPFPLLSIFF